MYFYPTIVVENGHCKEWWLWGVHITGFLLAVSRDKRNGAALFEQRQSIFYAEEEMFDICFSIS